MITIEEFEEIPEAVRAEVTLSPSKGLRELLK
jgi:hypothetical protein